MNLIKPIKQAHHKNRNMFLVKTSWGDANDMPQDVNIWATPELVEQIILEVHLYEVLLDWTDLELDHFFYEEKAKIKNLNSFSWVYKLPEEVQWNIFNLKKVDVTFINSDGLELKTNYSKKINLEYRAYVESHWGSTSNINRHADNFDIVQICTDLNEYTATLKEKLKLEKTLSNKRANLNTANTHKI